MPPELSLPRCALLLARISDARMRLPEGGWGIDSKGVDRQLRRLLDRAASLDWGVGPAATHHIVENDVSAYRRVMCDMPQGEPWHGRRERRPKRPDFWRAIQMLWDGEADGLIALDLDRACRDPRDLEDIIDVIAYRGVQVESVTGTLRGDPSVMRILVAVASKSSSDTARRVADDRYDAAHAGKYLGGWRRFGWEPGNTELRTWEWPDLDEPPEPGDESWARGQPVKGSEAWEVRNWADQVLVGVPLRQIALDLRQRQIPTSHKSGSDWSAAAVRSILLHPAIMGKLTYRPNPPPGAPRTSKSRLYTPEEIIGDAPWPPIISESDYWAVRAILTDEARRQGPGNTPKWLLSGLAVCGRCGDIMMRATGVGRFGEKEGRPEVPCYRCQSCSGLRRPVPFADAVVAGVITRYLAREDAGDLLPSAVPGTSRAALEAERADLEARRAAQLRLHREGIITDGELQTSLEAFRARLTAISAELGSTGAHSPLAGIAGRPDAAQIWEGLSLGLKREIIRACCEEPPVVFLHGKPPDVFNPELIAVNIKGAPGTVRPVRAHRAGSGRRGRTRETS